MNFAQNTEGPIFYLFFSELKRKCKNQTFMNCVNDYQKFIFHRLSFILTFVPFLNIKFTFVMSKE
jgi:hypothetical protein